MATDAPNTGRLAVVSIDTLASGSLAADLMGSFLGGKGKVAVTLSSLAITEHAEKQKAFASTLLGLYPQMLLQATIEDHDVESEAYEQSSELFKKHPDLAGIYVTTEASIPALNAARDAQMLDKITFITTDLSPALVRRSDHEPWRPRFISDRGRWVAWRFRYCMNSWRRASVPLTKSRWHPTW